MSFIQARAFQYVALISLFVLIGAGGYAYFRLKAAQTVTNNRPSFEAPLRTDLNLSAGTGVATYSRSDGADRRATVTDFEGLIRPVKANEARFTGARRVENLLTYSEDFSNAVWFTNGGTMKSVGQTDHLGGTKAVQVTDGGSTNSSFGQAYSTSIQNHTFVFSAWLKAGTASSAVLAIQQGSSPWEQGTASVSLTSEWKRFSLTKTFSNSSSSLNAFISVGTIAGTNEGTVYIAFAQLEEVTGQGNQNPSEYVSTNVKTAFPYHGAGVDGVRYFDYENGNTVSSNVVTEAKGESISEATLKGFLQEGTKTNASLRSEEFDNASWTKSNITVSADAVTAPDGRTSADTLTATAANATATQTFTSTAASYTFSVYLKRLTGSGTVSLSANGTDFTACTINSSTWTRCSDMRTFAGVSSYPLTIKIATSGDAVYAWGSQMEQQVFATSYIPTTSATVTRALDSLTYPMGDNFNDTDGSFSAEITTEWDSATAGTTVSTRFVGDATDAQYLSLWHWSGLAGHMGAERKGGSTRNNPEITSYTITAGQLIRMAMLWNSSAAKLFIDGSLRATDSTLTLPYNSLSGRTLRIGYGNDSFANIKNVRAWKKTLTDTEINNLTNATQSISNSSVKKSTDRPPNDTGLVGYWSFEDGSGTKATDFSGSGNAGTLTNGPTWVNGKFGKALNLSSASSQYALIGNVSALKNSVFTYSAWVNPASISNSMTVFSSGANSTPRIRLDSTSGTISLIDTNVVVMGTSSQSVSANVWTHLAISYDASGSYAFYLNGETAGSGTNSQSFSFGSAAFEIGRNGAANNEYFNGQIDDVRIYNRVLSADEILNLYQKASAAKMNISQNEKLTSDLIGLWSFNGPDLSGTTAYDRSGQGNNGTLTNGPAITEGRIGQALNFDGTNDYVTTADADIYSPVVNDMSVSFWAKVPIAATAAGNNACGNIGANMVAKGVNSQWEWTFENDNNTRMCFSVFNIAGSSGASITSIRTMNDGAWHHYAGLMNYSGNFISLYVDGTSAGTAGSLPTMGNGTQPVEIGRRGDGNYFSGSIDDVRVYNHVLSVSEIQELYNQGR